MAALAELPIESFAPPPAALTPATGARSPIGQNVVDTVGLPEVLASELLTRAGFVVELDPVPSDQYPAGYVIATEPGPGTNAVGGSQVIALVASGESPGHVPSILGRHTASARRALEHAGYVVEIVVQADGEPDVDAAGRVWKASTGSGRRLDPGSTVTIWINPGP